MDYLKNPMGIEEKSFEIIGEEMGEHSFTPEELLIVKRAIHTTADFEYKDLVEISGTAIETAKELFKKAYSNNHPEAKRAYNYVNDIVNGDKTYDDLLDLLEDEYGIPYLEDDVIDFAVEDLCNRIYINVIVNNGK